METQTHTTTATAVRPFRVDMPDEALADLRRRITATRLPHKETVADASQGVQLATLQALVRWDPAGFASRELEERAAAHLPPASVIATLTAPTEVLEGFLEELVLPPYAEVLGPLPQDVETSRAVVRVPRAEREQLTRALRHIQGARSTRKRAHVRVQMDPHDIG